MPPRGVPFECVNDVPCVPALFKTCALMNHLVPLRPVTTASPKEKAVGGMRHPARAIARLAHAREAGQAIRGILLRIIRRLCVLQSCLSAIGYDREDVGPTHDIIRDARDTVGWCSINRPVAIRSS